MYVSLVDQSCPTLEPPRRTNHLYSYGAVPPVAVAVNVIEAPSDCGALRSAVRLVRIRGSKASKWAVTVVAPVRVTVQGPLPVQPPPLQLPTEAAPAAGSAASRAGRPGGSRAEQVASTR